MASTSATTNFTSTSSSSTTTLTRPRAAPKPTILRRHVEKPLSRPVGRSQRADQYTNNIGNAAVHPPAAEAVMRIIPAEELLVTKNVKQNSNSMSGCGITMRTEYAVAGPRVQKRTNKLTKAQAAAKRDAAIVEAMERAMAEEADAEAELAATKELTKHDRVFLGKEGVKEVLAEQQQRRERAIAEKRQLDAEEREREGPWARYTPVVKPKGKLEKMMAKSSRGKKSGCPNGLKLT